ncbi:MAG: efflux RND transporter periplasmic adaptor subunit [Acidobacteriota bacterium]
MGGFVKEGQIIARLDDRDAKLRLDQALANQQQAEASVRQAQSRIGLAQNQNFQENNVPEVLAARAAYESAAAQAKLAEADSQRYANLISSGDVSRSAYDRAKTAAETAQAQANAARQQYEATLNAARQNYQGVATQEGSLQAIRAQVALARKAIADVEIRAPFTGYVSARPIAVGEHVDNNATIATILRITPLKLQLQVPQLYAPNVKIGLPVEANVSGFGERVFKGRVTAINPRGRNQFPHLYRRGRISEHGPRVEARYVRHIAHRAGRQHQGRVRAARRGSIGCHHQFIAGVHDCRRQGARRCRAAGRSLGRHDSNFIGSPGRRRAGSRSPAGSL